MEVSDKKGSVLVVKNFLNHNTKRPVESRELVEFWKSLTDEEKIDFTVGAAAALAS